MSIKEECIAHIELQIDDINTALAVLSLQSQMPGAIDAKGRQEQMHALRQLARLMANTLRIVKETNASARSDGRLSGDLLIGEGVQYKNFQHYM